MLEKAGRLQQFVALGARALIQRFDQDFDVPMRQGEASGLLEALGAFESDDLAVRVGAWWTRILHDDVTHRLLQGLERIQDSEPVAKELARRLNDRDLRDDAFPRYALARWFDSVGRVQFRCGDMMAARVAFREAKRLLDQHEDLWFARPDVRSNHLRAKFDERQRINDDSDLSTQAAAFEKELGAAFETGGRDLDLDTICGALEGPFSDALATGSGLVQDPGLVRALLPASTDDQARRYGELLRGVSNLLHNLSIVLKKRKLGDDVDRSRLLSHRSATLAFGLGDGYRLAQALQHGASLASGPTRAAWLEHVRARLPWQRGTWMAIQTLAKDGHAKGTEMLLGIIDDLEARRRLRGAELGLDVDVYKHTFDALAKVAPDHERLRGLRLDVARSVRRVVKVSIYRQRFAEIVYPAYLREIEETWRAAKDQTEGWEEHLATIEEASARELLDLLGQGRGHETQAVIPQPAPAPAGPTPITETEVASPRARAGRALSRETSEEARAAVAASREAFESSALGRSFNAVDHDVEVATVLRQFTAQKSDLAVLRYYLSGHDEKDRPTHLRALIVRNGRIRDATAGCPPDRRLDLAVVQRLAEERHTKGPTTDHARAIWDHLFAPVWSAVQEGGPPEHLVVIPAPTMFSLPLHIALPPGVGARPLCVQLPVSFSVSALAHVSRRRHLLRTQPIDPDDDLCALVPEDSGLRPRELIGLEWSNPTHFHVAGEAPPDLAESEYVYCGRGDMAGLRKLLERRAEFLVFCGHGVSLCEKEKDGRSTVEVALKLAGSDYLTQYDLLSGLKLRRNKLTILGACVSGLGGDTASGEVAGFLRSFIGAGAGALAVTKWTVLDDSIALVAGNLLRRIAKARNGNGTIDLVGSLFEIQKAAFEDAEAAVLAQARSRAVARDVNAPSTGDLSPALHACPLALYL